MASGCPFFFTVYDLEPCFIQGLFSKDRTRRGYGGPWKVLWKETDMLSRDLGEDQGLFRKDRTLRGYGGPWKVHWKETDMLSRDLGEDQEVIHACDWMYNFLVSTEHVRFLPWTNMDSTIAPSCPILTK